jgi:hypothetical protein
VSAQFLQCTADISSAPRLDLLLPLLIILYSTVFLMLVVELWIESREGEPVREIRNPIVPEKGGRGEQGLDIACYKSGNWLGMYNF